MSMPAQLLQCHHVVRVVAVATSIVTARHLFAIGFHYPLLMLLAHVSIALVLGGLGARGGDATTIQKRPHSWTLRLWQALFTASVAVGLIFTYHSFLHNRNTTLGVMLLGLDWATVLGRSWRWLRQDKQHSVDMPLSTATFLLCIVLLLWKENWLVGKGIEFVLVAVVCMTVARHLWRGGLVDGPITLGTVHTDPYSAGLAVCLPLAAFMLAVTGWYNRRDFHIQGRIMWLLISIISGALSLATETTLKKLTASLQDKIPFNTKMNFTFGNPIFPWLVLIIVEFDNVFSQHRPSTTSAVQWFSFVIAYFTTIDIAWMASPVALANEQVPYIPIPSLKPREEPTDETKSPTPEDMEAMYLPDFNCDSESSFHRHVSLAWQAILGTLALLLVFYSVVGTPHTDPGRRSWDLDIVIAWYDEPIEQVIRTAELALDLPNIAGRKVRTIVYNKGNLNETELEVNFPVQSRLVIRRLENVGREGDTYLTHALEREQDWASHTLFIQAEPHEPGYLQARLEDYFVEQTGFLSLSHVRNFCPSCDTCNDHSGWTEEGTVLRDIFGRSNPDKTCQDISLTYRGQFVVSSHRMKRANQGLLRELRGRLIEDEHLGFTLERSWGTIFQCPTISERCPTLLSGWMGNRAAVEDCQCLDTIGS
ncbi:hypothetical protein SAMD00023353_10500170 [Rosellinia necatrix]|uniref:Uncharacterized protein n=1 Tax=Rosellinia necatrix TaxID=77044 RepID=A0A1W2TW65_ROSNE|nr:hypothetical protein SAMD00023353_10500170 [Rosellinia necatrix]